MLKGPSTLATLFNHMWPRIVAGIFIPVGNHYFQALASTLQFVAQVCHRQSVCIQNIHVAATSRPSVLGSATMRGHMWLNKVASVLGPKNSIFFNQDTKFAPIAESQHTGQHWTQASCLRDILYQPEHNALEF